MFAGIDYVTIYMVSALDPRVLLDMIRSLPGFAWVIGGLLYLRFQAQNPFVWISSVIAPSFWKQPVFRPSNGYPLVSVVIATRNEGRRVDAAIRSVLACGWPNVEIIVADDYSDDGSWKFPKEFERTGRVRVMGNPRHGGKTTALNHAITSCRADYILVMDAQCQIECGTLGKMMGELTSDHRIGAVTGPFRVISGDLSLVTMWQEWDYSRAITERMVRSKLGLIITISGAGGVFRKEALAGVGLYDPGLGDDTDITLRLRKQGWKLRFCHDAAISIDPPHTYAHLIRQRQRWKRNMVKIRIHKHWDMILPWRYGWKNSLLMLDFYLVNVVLVFVGIVAALYFWTTEPFGRPIFLGPLYMYLTLYALLKGLLTKDLSGMPRWITFLYVPIYFVVTVPVHLAVIAAIVMEFLRIGARHPYVPKYLWREAPRW